MKVLYFNFTKTGSLFSKLITIRKGIELLNCVLKIFSVEKKIHLHLLKTVSMEVSIIQIPASYDSPD